MTNTETLLVIGDSPFLTEVQNKVHYALDKYSSIGINRAIQKHKVSVHAFVDIGMVMLSNRHEEVKKLTIPEYSPIVRGEKEIFNTFSFNWETDNAISKGNSLAWCGFTHDYVVSYAIHKGFKKVILIGAADFSNDGHFSCRRDFRYSETLGEASRKFLEEFCSKRIEIYTCNPNSRLRVPYKPLDELLT